MTYLLLTVIGVLVTAAAAPVFATERVEWNGDPILIRLSTGFERRVIVRGATGISIGIPDTATPNLHAQSIGDSFWLTANAPIDSARIILKIHPAGTTVVAEVRSMPDIPPPGNLFIAIPSDQPAAESPIEKRPGFASLTRWAVQQLYSPERLKQIRCRESLGIPWIPIQSTYSAAVRIRLPVVAVQWKRRHWPDGVRRRTM